MKKPMKMEEIGLKSQEGQKNTHSFVLCVAVSYREIKVKTC